MLWIARGGVNSIIIVIVLAIRHCAAWASTLITHKHSPKEASRRKTWKQRKLVCTKSNSFYGTYIHTAGGAVLQTKSHFLLPLCTVYHCVRYNKDHFVLLLVLKRSLRIRTAWCMFMYSINCGPQRTQSQGWTSTSALYAPGVECSCVVDWGAPSIHTCRWLLPSEGMTSSCASPFAPLELVPSI